jgi:putative ABC transport system ATP-binding protein
MSRAPVIVFEDVWKIYRLGKVEYPALRGLTLTIERGEFVAIVGPSGSGKSTFLHIAGTLDRPTRGKVLVDGVDPTGLGDEELSRIRNRRIGFVFQAYNLVSRFTAVQNVELPLIRMGLPPAERRRRAVAALKEVGLGHRLRNRPTELSGGEQQRVAVARAIVTEPSILLCDEPTGNLDSVTAQELVHLLAEINQNRGTTLVIVTHDMAVAQHAQRIVRLRDGRVEAVEVAPAA